MMAMPVVVVNDASSLCQGLPLTTTLVSRDAVYVQETAVDTGSNGAYYCVPLAPVFPVHEWPTSAPRIPSVQATISGCFVVTYWREKVSTSSLTTSADHALI